MSSHSDLVKAKVLNSDTIRNWSSTDPHLLRQPHPPAQDYGTNTRIPYPQHDFYPGWYIGQSTGHPTVKKNNTLEQTKYDLIRNKINHPNDTWNSTTVANQVLPEKGIRFDGRFPSTYDKGLLEPMDKAQMALNARQSQIQHLSAEGTNRMGDWNTASPYAKETKKKKGGAKKKNYPTVNKMIQRHHQEFADPGEEEEMLGDSNVLTKSQLEQTQPMNDTRASINQMKNIIQEVSYNAEQGQKASMSSLESDQILKAIGTLEKTGESLSRRELTDLRNIVEVSLNNVNVAKGQGRGKIRLLLIFYLYDLKLLSTVNKQKRTDALRSFMDQLVSADSHQLFQLSRSVRSQSTLSNERWDRLYHAMTGKGKNAPSATDGSEYQNQDRAVASLSASDKKLNPTDTNPPNAPHALPPARGQPQPEKNGGLPTQDTSTTPQQSPPPPPGTPSGSTARQKTTPVTTRGSEKASGATPSSSDVRSALQQRQSQLTQQKKTANSVQIENKKALNPLTQSIVGQVALDASKKANAGMQTESRPSSSAGVQTQPAKKATAETQTATPASQLEQSSKQATRKVKGKKKKEAPAKESKGTQIETYHLTPRPTAHRAQSETVAPAETRAMQHQKAKEGVHIPPEGRPGSASSYKTPQKRQRPGSASKSSTSLPSVRSRQSGNSFQSPVQPPELPAPSQKKGAPSLTEQSKWAANRQEQEKIELPGTVEAPRPKSTETGKKTKSRTSGMSHSRSTSGIARTRNAGRREASGAPAESLYETETRTPALTRRRAQDQGVLLPEHQPLMGERASERRRRERQTRSDMQEEDIDEPTGRGKLPPKTKKKTALARKLR